MCTKLGPWVVCADAHVCVVHVCACEVHKCMCLVRIAALLRREVCELCIGGCLGTFLGLSVHLYEESGGRHPDLGGEWVYGKGWGSRGGGTICSISELVRVWGVLGPHCPVLLHTWPRIS